MGKNNTVGRPTKMTPDRVNKLEEAFALGCTDIEACLYADISKECLYQYQDKFPEFVGRKEQLKQRPILLARSELIKGLKGNPELALKFLERKLKNEFSLRTEITAANGKDLINTLDSLETKYDLLGSEIEQQKLAPNPLVQDQRQTGQASDVLPK